MKNTAAIPSLPPVRAVAASEIRVRSGLDRRADRRDFAARMEIFSFIGDLAVTAWMLLLAYWVRFVSPLKGYGLFAEAVVFNDYLGHIFIGVALMGVLLVNFRTYNPQHLLSLTYVSNSIAKACLAWVVCFMGVSFVLKFEPSISRFYCGIGFGLSLVGLLTWRVMLNRLVRREQTARRLKERVLFVGWTEDTQQLVERLTQTTRHTFEVAGVLTPPGGFGKLIPGDDIRVAGEYDELQRIISREDIDVVLVSDLNLTRDELTSLSVLCEKELVDFKIVPNCFQILLSGLSLESISGVPVLGVSRLPLHSSFNQYLKRTVDICGALIGLLLSAPIIAAFGLMVWLEDRGPIFYGQTRIGRDGKAFRIWKIRSMKRDSEKHGVGWTVKGDKRLLRCGAFMRKCNIDEVPQFWNVLTGEMSLVGPRPERPELIHNLKEEIPHYQARHDVKPGITGWAQVNGFRGDTCLRERIKCDLFYIENWNLFWDFQIMLLTFVKRENAC
jgi:exopolysaccharide biosynthesis polyprenyl glycosylphosphotransferase